MNIKKKQKQNENSSSILHTLSGLNIINAAINKALDLKKNPRFAYSGHQKGLAYESW